MMPSGSNGIYLILDDKGNFKKENFSKAFSGWDNNDVKNLGNSKNQKANMNKTFLLCY